MMDNVFVLNSFFPLILGLISSLSSCISYVLYYENNHKYSLFTIVVSKIQVFDGDSDQATSLGKFCGSSIPVVPPSTSHVMMMRFQSDDLSKRKGFLGRLGKLGMYKP